MTSEEIGREIAHWLEYNTEEVGESNHAARIVAAARQVAAAQRAAAADAPSTPVPNV